MWEQLIEDVPRFFGFWNLMFLGQALLNTLLLSYLGAAFGFALGFCLAIGRHPRLYGIAPLRLLATAMRKQKACADSWPAPLVGPSSKPSCRCSWHA